MSSIIPQRRKRVRLLTRARSVCAPIQRIELAPVSIRLVVEYY